MRDSRKLRWLVVVLFAGMAASWSTGRAAEENRSVLIVYFSRVGNTSFPPGLDTVTRASVIAHEGRYFGNTELVARWIQAEVGGDLFLIQTGQPYSPDYDETVRRGEQENRDGVHPPLATRVPDIGKYDVVFLGYPAWAYDIPMPLYSFLDNHDLSGKTVIPFSTSGGSSVNQTSRTIQRLQPRVKLLPGITVSHNQIVNARESVVRWVRGLQF
ncbi:MAG: flavodoxin [Planctomycetes bacterium]|nr:flavodoxin [Planctomycetota bacterium]